MLLTAKLHTANDDARLNPTHSLTHSLILVTSATDLADPSFGSSTYTQPCRQYCAATWSM